MNGHGSGGWCSAVAIALAAAIFFPVLLLRRKVRKGKEARQAGS
jgi:hypothetical protein